MRDAEPAEFPDARLPRLEPRAPTVWIRTGGVWRAGWIVKWVRAGGGWLVWARWRGVPGSQVASPWAWLVYDPETIRRRDGEQPPG